jgi:hypothetical protein
MAQARRWLCRAGCALCRPQPEIAAEIYKASEKLCASPELLGTVGADGDTLTDEAILADLKRFNEKATIFDEVICRAGRVVDG